MTEQPQPVTLVTRNENHLWKATIEIGSLALAIYYLNHPDMFDRMKEWIGTQCKRAISKFRIWDTRAEIRNLPETERE